MLISFDHLYSSANRLNGASVTSAAILCDQVSGFIKRRFRPSIRGLFIFHKLHDGAQVRAQELAIAPPSGIQMAAKNFGALATIAVPKVEEA